MKRQTPQVTPVAKATEIAISEVKRKNAEGGDKHKKSSLKRKKNTNVLQYRPST
jgi:hypothetical protein